MSSPPKSRSLKPAKDALTVRPPASRKRNPSGRISAACEACKKRKTKCTGGPPPCQLCESLETECIIDPSLDMRRRAALQRTIDESKAYQDSLAGLVDCLRDGDTDLLESLIESLQKDLSPQELSATIQHFTGLVRGQDIRSGTEELLISPSDDSIGDQSIYPLQSSSAGSGNSPFERKGREDMKSSPLGGSTGKAVEFSGYYVALLNQLRLASNIDGQRILRDLVDISDLEKFFQHSFAGTSSHFPVRDPESMISNHSTEMQTQAHKRKNWHPALQVGPGSFLPQLPIAAYPTTGQTSGPTLDMQVGSIGRAIRDDGDAAAADFHSSGAHLASPPILRLQIESMYSDGSEKIVKSAPVVSKIPYTEQIITSLVPECTDLFVAHADPAYRWRIPIHLIQPPIIPDGSPICRVYTEYLQAAKNMLANGTEVWKVLGSGDDIIINLLFRQREQSDGWDCSSWACELVRSFGEYDIFVRLANVYFLTQLMRWLLVSNIENYDKIPDMMKPTPTQRQVAHIGAIDLIPIPCVRDAAISSLRDWLTPLGQSRWTVNWPFTEQDAIEENLSNGSMRLSQRFLDHVQEYDNWSVGSSFLATFPEVSGLIKIHA